MLLATIPDFVFPLLGLVGWLAAIGLAAAIGQARGRLLEGLGLGVLLGPLGMLLTALLPPRHVRRCPECRYGIPARASRCGHCGAELGRVAV